MEWQKRFVQEGQSDDAASSVISRMRLSETSAHVREGEFVGVVGVPSLVLLGLRVQRQGVQVSKRWYRVFNQSRCYPCHRQVEYTDSNRFQKRKETSETNIPAGGDNADKRIAERKGPARA